MRKTMGATGATPLIPLSLKMYLDQESFGSRVDFSSGFSF